jgi:hypothetical protein
LRNKNISKKLKVKLKNTITDETSTYATENWILTLRDRKQIQIFERKMYTGIIAPVYDKEKENWRILTNKEIYAMVQYATDNLSRQPIVFVSCASVYISTHSELLGKL